ncbi:MAG: hypothetical protein KKC51_10430, partial [Verrucomicrobia bacterium]|nr:hypothetical protein [Verrucomicrobiota bacterium]
PLLWASVVLLILAGIYFLEHPKQFLMVMFLYYGFMANGLLLGFYSLPIPMVGILDEAILAVPMAIIVMKAVHRQLPRHATIFPVVYVALAVLSAWVNHAPNVGALRVILTYGKFYIFWYFARAIGPWSAREKRMWFVVLMLFVLLQFGFNVFWQKGLTPRMSVDSSIGTVGSAHYVGYLATVALFLLAGWLASMPSPRPKRLVALALGIALLNGYNLIFMTDTKHVLFFMPFAALPFLFYPRYPAPVRMALGVGGAVFLIASWIYFALFTSLLEFRPSAIWRSIKYSGKGEVFRTLVYRLPEDIPVYLLGAGPGNFCSSVGLFSFRPLSNKYVLPYVITAFRSRGLRAEASIAGRAQSSLYTLWGEFGPINAIAYLLFWLYAMRHLWRVSVRAPPRDFDAGQRLAIIASLITFLIVGLLTEVSYIGLLMLPLWSLAGMYWDEAGVAAVPAEPANLPARVPRPGFISFSGRA